MLEETIIRPAKIEISSTDKRAAINIKRLLITWTRQNEIKTLNLPTIFARPVDMIEFIRYLCHIGHSDYLKLVTFHIYLNSDTSGAKVLWRPEYDETWGIIDRVEWQHGGYGRRMYLDIIIPLNTNLPVDIRLMDGTFISAIQVRRFFMNWREEDHPGGLSEREEEISELMKAYRFRSYHLSPLFMGRVCK